MPTRNWNRPLRRPRPIDGALLVVFSMLIPGVFLFSELSTAGNQPAADS
jgi:hypothetical protein